VQAFSVPFDAFEMNTPVDGMPPICDWLTTFASMFHRQDLRIEPVDCVACKRGLDRQSVRVIKGFTRLTTLFYIFETAAHLDPSSSELDVVVPFDSHSYFLRFLHAA
jgi:hypothetical protein